MDVATDSLIVEMTGTEEKIEGMIEVLRPIGIMEMVRTGQVAMTRGAYAGIRRTAGANGNGWHDEDESGLAEY